MVNENEPRLIYFEGEEPLVRRLGAALVSCWNDIPSETQNKLLDRAMLVLDEDHSDQLSERMKQFVGAHTRSG